MHSPTVLVVAEDSLQAFFGHTRLLLTAMDERAPMELLSSRMSDPPASRVPGVCELLERAGVRSMVIVPLVSSEECLGALVMASSSRRLGEDWLSFLLVKPVDLEALQELILTAARPLPPEA
jgi:hypothetical protein